MNNYMIDDTYFESKYKIIMKAYLARLIWLVCYSRNHSPLHENVNKLNTELIKITDPISDTEYKSFNQWSVITRKIISNIKEKGIDNFLQWECIKETMGEENSSFLYKEYKYLKNNKLWKEIKDNITYPKVGNPLPFLGNIKLTGAIVHHSYCLVKFLDKSNLKINEIDNIFEFGGGYGNMCKTIHEIGFTGSYHIFDLEVMSAIQQYFLNSHRLNKVLLFHDPDKWESVLNTISGYKKNLFISTWSLSECPLYIRKITRDHLHLFKYFLVGFQEEFGETNNILYFNEIKDNLEQVEWFEEIMPMLPKHHLLIGY
ncbi:hypothetical protein [Brenneria rubrifaciens]|uniref:Sugar O-methyltransferase n=1 Tax=Brenneria rubrifaciens TaxID=55213 RepID=A0A4P8QMJ3_9GAMM|nr:hypothetical protein [Brenneria rubrifaciens]QCR08128.1 hypothetical protein EH207_06100 [Brenneria rubrifaciens]